MWKGLIDSNNTKAELGTILKVENRITNKTSYYLYNKIDNREYLFKYNRNGKIEYESFENIKVDEGVSLVNDEYRKWTIEGWKEEVYNNIFSK